MPDYKEVLNGIHLHILEAGLFCGDLSWRFDRIVSPFNRLYWMLEGEGLVRFDVSNAPAKCAQQSVSEENIKFHRGAQEWFTMRAGHVYLIPAGLTCDYLCPVHFVKFYMHANIRMYGHEDLFKDLDGCLEQPWPVQQTEEMVQLASMGTEASLLRLKALVLETMSMFLAMAGNQAGPQNAARTRYGTLLRAIMENPAHVTPKSLAEMHRVPLASLNRTFRQEMGMTLRQYIRSSLMEQVKIRLQSTDVPIRTIACESGFEDEFYFSRLFHHHVGVSPSSYRKRNRMT